MNEKHPRFLVEINGGPTQPLEVKTGLYELAAMAALATLDYDKRDDFDVVKIWSPNLLPEYGPYFYTYGNAGGIGELVGNDSRKW
jgi:hypothetical protein